MLIGGSEDGGEGGMICSVRYGMVWFAGNMNKRGMQGPNMNEER